MTVLLPLRRRTRPHSARNPEQTLCSALQLTTLLTHLQVCWLFGSLWAASATDEADFLQQCILNFDPNVDYYQKSLPPGALNDSFVLPIPLDLQEVETATGFAVNYGNYYKVVENQFFNLTYVLYQCGATRPIPSAIGLPAATDARTFELPLANVSVDSTIPLAFLELLGGLRNLSLTSSATDYVSSSCVLQYIDEGSIRRIPDSDVESTRAIFTSALGTPINDSNAVSFDATYDGGPLKRGEWIKYMATFLNAEDRADEIFTYISTSYKCMTNSSANFTSAPKVAWLRYEDGFWYVSNATYKLQFDLDAGGTNLDDSFLGMNFNSSNRSELQSFHQLLTQLDVIIDETAPADPYKYTFNNFMENVQESANGSSMPALENKRVWRVDKRLGLNDGYDWYESAIPQPHVVLHDLIGILHPSKEWNQTYFRNVAKGEGIVNVSALPCTRLLDQERDAVVIEDPAIMTCVNATLGTQESSDTSGVTLAPFEQYYHLAPLLSALFWLLC